MPGFIAPQLCELVSDAFRRRLGASEAKLDLIIACSFACEAARQLSSAAVGLDWTHRFPEIVAAAGSLADCIIDGEVCAVDFEGLPSFAGLTDALKAKSTGRLVYYVFDMMWGGGQSLAASPLLIRKKALKSALAKLSRTDKKRFAFVDHHKGDGHAMHQSACDMKLEGIVSKRIDAAYAPGDRSGIWTKAKCRPSQELVVGGWKMTGAAFRSLAVGAYVGGELVHVGTVGTGYNRNNLPELMKALKARENGASPFDVVNDPKALRGVHWVKPDACYRSGDRKLDER